MSDPQVAIVMGSDSDFEVMANAADLLDGFGVSFEMRVLSAHRTPEAVAEWASGLEERGVQMVIAGAGGSAALAGTVAAFTPIPVVGVPIPTKHLQGLDSLYSTVQMPSGIPVASMGIGSAGAKNAAIFAAELLALNDPRVRQQVETHRAGLKSGAQKKQARVDELLQARRTSGS